MEVKSLSQQFITLQSFHLCSNFFSHPVILLALAGNELLNTPNIQQ